VTRVRPLTWLLLGFIKLWRLLISPLYGNVCKYHPSCSAYGLRAVEVHGALKGSGLIVWRLLRCNPWSPGGYDPVPGTPEAAQWTVEQHQTNPDQQPDWVQQEDADHGATPQPAGASSEPAGATTPGPSATEPTTEPSGAQRPTTTAQPEVTL
jgi:uncharacterized protein